MTVEDARKELRGWLEDLAALRDHCDPSNPAAAPFNDAWKVALEKAKVAATNFVEAAGGGESDA